MRDQFMTRDGGPIGDPGLDRELRHEETLRKLWANVPPELRTEDRKADAAAELERRMAEERRRMEAIYEVTPEELDNFVEHALREAA